jgi:lysine 2,3-aminomutase
VRSLEQLEAYIPLVNKGRLESVLKNLRFSITPHTLQLIDFTNPNDPLLRMCIPSERELLISPEELRDPIGDEVRSPIPYVTHRYPDRALIYVTFFLRAFLSFLFSSF